MQDVRTLHERSHPAAAVEIGLLGHGSRFGDSEADAFELCMVMSGTARDRRKGCIVDHGPGAATFNLPGRRPAFEPVDGHLRYVSVIVSSWLVERTGLDRIDPFHARSDPRLAAVLTRIAGESLEPDDIADLIVEGLLLEGIGTLARKSPPADPAATPWLRHLHDRILSDPAAHESVETLAQDAGYTPDYVAKSYRAAYGRSIGEARRDARLRLAADLLDGSGLGVAEIALASGFYDQAHLSRWFRRTYGTTPLAWRARRRDG